MRTLLQTLFFFLLVIQICFAQGVGINTSGAAADASAILDVSSTTQGFLPPRMTEAQRTAISSPATGLLVFQTNGTSGLYYYTATQWLLVSALNPSYEIGDNALGGIVFYVNADGTHGLVAAAQDQFNTEWVNAHDNLNNPAFHDTEGAKYSDWRLPSKYELNLMYQQKATIGNFTDGEYWSSTEYIYWCDYKDYFAWVQTFYNGNQNMADKCGGGYVRAVRSF